MSILTLILRNAGLATHTLRPEETLPRPTGGRGSLRHNLADCVGCTTCAYVCPSAAITLEPVDRQSIVWQYNAGQCAFCGQCVTYCPTGALISELESAPLTGDRASQRVRHRIEFRPCDACGQPTSPLPVTTLIALYGAPLPPEIIARQRLCPECRKRDAGTTLKRRLHGEPVHER